MLSFLVIDSSIDTTVIPFHNGMKESLLSGKIEIELIRFISTILARNVPKERVAIAIWFVTHEMSRWDIREKSIGVVVNIHPMDKAAFQRNASWVERKFRIE